MFVEHTGEKLITLKKSLLLLILNRDDVYKK